MTAEWSKLPFDFLGKVSNRIVNELEGVSRVVYDISGKPPTTIGGNSLMKPLSDFIDRKEALNWLLFL